MSIPSLPGILEATRLTREGRVAEATALLQGVLQVKTSPKGPTKMPGLTRPNVSRPAAASNAVMGPMVLEALSDALTFKDQGALKLPLGDLPIGYAPKPAEPLPEGAQFLAATFSNKAGSRPYKLYVPSGYHGQAVPLIVMLHGCTQSPDDFATGTRMNAAAEEETFLVVYPGQTVAANPSRCWNWFKPGDQRRDLGEPALIAGLTREIMNEYCVDQRRVYVAGLSAGGAAAAIMGATYPDLYAAVGVHSGLACGAASDLPSAFAAMRQGMEARAGSSGVSGHGNGRGMVPTIVFHGDQDTTVSPRNGDAVIAQSTPSTPLVRSVRHGGVPGGHTYSQIRHTDSAGRCVLEQWVIHGAGHAWAGGSPAGSYTDPRGPDASREMLRFFFAQPHPVDPQVS